MEVDEKEMRRQIQYAIRNIHGVRTGLFTPDKAFETMARSQIALLKEPSMKCIDFVVSELTVVVKRCSEVVREVNLALICFRPLDIHD